MPHQRVKPGEEQVALVPQLAAERPALLALYRLEPGPVLPRLGRREHADGKGKAVAAVLFDGFTRQELGHGQTPMAFLTRRPRRHDNAGRLMPL